MATTRPARTPRPRLVLLPLLNLLPLDRRTAPCHHALDRPPPLDSSIRAVLLRTLTGLQDVARPLRLACDLVLVGGHLRTGRLAPPSRASLSPTTPAAQARRDGDQAGPGSKSEARLLERCLRPGLPTVSPVSHGSSTDPGSLDSRRAPTRPSASCAHASRTPRALAHSRPPPPPHHLIPPPPSTRPRPRRPRRTRTRPRSASRAPLSAATCSGSPASSSASSSSAA